MRLEERLLRYQKKPSQGYNSFGIGIVSIFSELEIINVVYSDVYKLARLFSSLQSDERYKAVRTKLTNKTHGLDWHTTILTLRQRAHEIKDLDDRAGYKPPRHGEAHEALGEAQATTTRPPRARAERPAPAAAPPDPCRNFLAGDCRFGASCRYSHSTRGGGRGGGGRGAKGGGRGKGDARGRGAKGARGGKGPRGPTHENFPHSGTCYKLVALSYVEVRWLIANRSSPFLT